MDQEQAEVVTGYMNALGLESWVGQVFVVVFVTVALNFLVRRVLTKAHAQLERTRTPWDDAVIWAMRRPLPVLVWVIGIAFAAQIVRAETAAMIFEAVEPIRDVCVIACLAWFLVRFIRQAETNIVEAKQSSGEPFDRTTLDAIAKLLRLSVLITAALVALQTLGFSVSGVLAFGGIGGIAIGFAAKDLLANFFGGLIIYLDRPFAVGDWIRSPDRDIEGVVEKIGWRLTEIRTFDSRPLYIPNSTFTNIAVQNPSRMKNRRIYEYVGIRYDDAGAMAAIVGEVVEMLKSHDDIDTRQTLMVNFDRYAPSSLDFFVYCFTKTKNWARYHSVKQDVMLRILDIVERHGAEVAFPTSTVHVENAIPPAALAAQAAAGDQAAE